MQESRDMRSGALIFTLNPAERKERDDRRRLNEENIEMKARLERLETLVGQLTEEK